MHLDYYRTNVRITKNGNAHFTTLHERAFVLRYTGDMENTHSDAPRGAFLRPLPRRIQREIDRITGLGLLPRALVLGISEYEELCGLEAVAQGLHSPEMVSLYEGCIVFAVDKPGTVLVLPDVREMWEGLEQSILEFTPNPLPRREGAQKSASLLLLDTRDG